MEKKVIGYARVSTDSQDIPRQTMLIKQFCLDKGYYLVRVISQKISGAAEQRDSLDELKQLTSKDCDLIVATELSRLGRDDDLTKATETMKKLVENGLDVVLLDKPDHIYKAHTYFSAMEIIELTLKAQFAKEERMKITERTTSGKINVINQNHYAFVGQAAPFGFKVIENPDYNGRGTAKCILAIDEEERKDIEYIFDSVISGKTLHQIAREFNQQGKRTVRNGAKFTESTIGKTIRNTLYKGERRYKGRVYNIEAIISPERWDLANSLIVDNQLFRGVSSKNFNPLKGLIYCPCGYAMLLHSNSGSGWFTLHCCKRTSDKEHRVICNNKGIRATLLLNCVWHAVSTYLVGSNYRVKSNEQIDRLQESNQILLNRIADLEKSSKDNEKAKERTFKQLEIADDEELIKRINNRYAELREEAENIQKQIQQLKEDVAKNEKQIKVFSEQATSEHLASLNEIEKAEVYKDTLSRVVYYSHNLLCGFIVIDFKNGYQRIIAVNNNGNNQFAIDVPDTYKFDEEQRKVGVEVTPANLNMHKFSFKSTMRYFDFKEFVKSLDETEFEQLNIMDRISLDEIDFKGLAVQAGYAK